MSTERDQLDTFPDSGEPVDTAWERTLDAVYASLADVDGAGGEPIDAGLRARLEREGAAALAAPVVIGRVGGAVARPAAALGGWMGWVGWGAAALIGMAFLIFGVPAQAPTTDALIAQVDRAADVVSWPFSGTTDEFKGASGSVVWSTTLQKGYMRLKGVPMNTPSAAQYQLWIVDPARDKNPVDGGVFDIARGEAVVPIDAKLAVATPAAFAITREKPGGVVVSAGPLLLVAKP